LTFKVADMSVIGKACRLSVVVGLAWVSLAATQVQPVPPGADAKRRSDAEKLAKTTLVRSKSLPPASIEVESIEPTTWQDTSLGCPAPDMMYAQRLVAGYKVVLRSGGTRYNVHVGEGNAVLCDQSAPQAATQVAQIPPDVQAYRLAREAAAAARGVPADRILLKRVRPLAASDPRCKMPEGLKPGGGTVYLVELMLGDEIVYYVADRLAAVPCQTK
jgi:hypothetical protein